MKQKVDIADVMIWGTKIGSIAWDEAAQVGFFEYEASFLNAPIEIAPLTMPKKRGIYSFPALSRSTFMGLPGLLADCLPDKFGNLLIDQWLAEQGRLPDDFSPVERLCYMGSRSMGAIEFKPTVSKALNPPENLQINELVRLANVALKHRKHLKAQLSTDNDQINQESLNQIISVGTSAGGARAKAVIAWNRQTGEIQSGQIPAPKGFEHWILKFDGVSGNKDKELDDPQGYGKIEYAYYLMAKDAGITMMESQLLKENHRAHFITRRFDRTINGQKHHMQTLCGIAHFDYNQAGAYSYEQAFQVIRRLKMTNETAALDEQYRRLTFNVIGRNQDDHTKNISFMMDRAGQWSLSPAYDMTYSYNASGKWTSTHQMSINGKRSKLTLHDLIEIAKVANIKPTKAKKIIQQVARVFSKWPDFAKQSGVNDELTKHIAENHRNL